MDQVSSDEPALVRIFTVPRRLRTPLRRRVAGIALALAAEILLLLALLSLNQAAEPIKESHLTEVDLAASDYAEAAEEQTQPDKSEPQPESPATPQPVETAAAVPLVPEPPPAAVIPLPTAPTAPAPAPRPAPPAADAGPAYGPPDTGRPQATDSERVGTAPDGTPLYKAQWYRRPGPEFWGYFSAASAGSGLMACRTIADFYITDCVALGDTPGSMINRSMLAGSGTLMVRPPRLGGRSLVGAWVRIRIDYSLRTVSR